MLQESGIKQADKYKLFDDLLHANIQISLDKLLNIVPNFKQHIVEKISLVQIQ